MCLPADVLSFSSTELGACCNSTLTKVNLLTMLLTGNEMSKNSYVIPTVVLQKLIDAAAARHSKVCCLICTFYSYQMVIQIIQ